MAITQVGTTVEQGITYGFSKWCNELFSDGDWKPSELAKYSWCRWRDKYIGCCSATSTDIHTQQGAAVTQLLSYFNSSLSDTSSNYVAYYNDSRIPTKEPYCFNILMYGRNGDQTLTSDCASNYRVITSCSDFQSLYVLVNKYQPAQSTINVDYPTARTVNCNNLMWANGGVYNTNNDAHAQWITVWTVFVIDEDNFFVTRGMAFPNSTPCMYDGVIGAAQKNLRPSNDLSISYGNRITESKWRYYYGDITNYQKTMHLLRWYKNGITGIEPQTWGDSKYGVYDVDDDVAIIMRSANAVYGNIGIRYTYYLKSEEAVKNAIAYTGLRWKYQEGDTTHVYTPIIDDDGYITGYSTDPEAVTKLNDIVDVTGNNIAPLPPAPPTPSGLDSDEQSTGGAYGSGGFVKMYACKKSELKDLQKWMSGGPAGPGGTDPTTIPENFNPIEQFIGLTGFPIEIPTGTYDGTTFVFRAADNTPVNTGINTKTTLTGTQKYMTKSLDIPTWEKNDNAVPWMDYGATVECYVPFCGVVGLDPQVVMGHSIRIQMWVDFVSGDCSAYVECNNDGWHPVAYVGGNLGCAEAMTAAAYGQLMGARAAGAHQMTQAIIGGVKNAVTGTVNSAVSNYARAYGNNNLPVPAGQSASLANAIASATGKISGGAYGATAAITNAVNLGVSLTQQNLDNRYNYTVAKNSLGTTIAGSFGSQSSWHYPIMPYVKVTWPTPMSKDVTNYGKTFGVPVHKTGNLKDYHGYTICNNVDTSGISTATAEEQSMIKQYLESGVYLP